MKPFYYSLPLAVIIFFCRPKEVNTNKGFSGKAEVPFSIKQEHDTLLRQIQKLSLFEDSAGQAGKKLHQLIEHHFKEEESFVLPQLGLLPLLASGKLPDRGAEVIELSGKLESHLLHLKAEHQLIKAYVDELKQVAAKKDLPEIIALEEELKKHANTEEEIFFPAAVLVRDFLKLKSS